MPCPRQGARGSVGVWNDVALARQLAQEVEDGLVECRVLDLGRDVGEGNQHEPAQVKEGMRDLEPVLGDDLVRVKQDVDVQRSLTRGAGRIRRRDAARPALDRLGQAQEPVGWEIGFDLDRAVEVPYLARRAQLGPRRRFIDLGASDDADVHLRAQEGKGRLQVPPAVTQVRAEGQEHPRHAYRLRVMRTPGTATTPPRGAVTFRTVTVTSRAG